MKHSTVLQEGRKMRFAESYEGLERRKINTGGCGDIP
jgi:hypothetical protein